MTVKTNSMRHAAQGLQWDSDQVKAWKKRILTKDRLVPVGMFAFSVALFGYLTWCIARAMQTYTVVGGW